MNEGNIDSYLAELEDFVNQILLYKSKKNQPNMFFTSTLLIDEIPYKDFRPKNIVYFLCNFSLLLQELKVMNRLIKINYWNHKN